MTHTMRGSIGTLRAVMTGPVVGPADPDYDQARRVRNAGSTDTDDDRQMRVARRRGHGGHFRRRPRPGGHGARRRPQHFRRLGRDHGLMIALSELNQVTVDTKGKRAWVGGGALLADLDACRCRQSISAVPCQVR